MCVSFLLLSFKLSSGCLFSPHQVNQGGVQKTTSQITLNETHTAEESLKRLRNGRHNQVLSDHSDQARELLHVLLPRGKSHHLIRNSKPFFPLCQEGSHSTRSGTPHHSFHPVCLSPLRLLTHRFPIHMLGRLGLFACFALSHTLFRTLCSFADITTVCLPHLVFSKKKIFFLEDFSP